MLYLLVELRARIRFADECVVNLFIGVQGEAEGLSEKEIRGVERYSNFGSVGNAYAREHGTRPATIGLVLSSSPIALLAW